MPILPFLVKGGVAVLRIIGTASTGWVIADWFNTTKRVEEAQADEPQGQPVSIFKTLYIAAVKNLPLIITGVIAWLLGTYLYNRFINK